MAASKVCPSCGAVNTSSNAFCIHCGKPLPGTPSPTVTQAYPPAYPPGYPPTAPPGGAPPPGAYPYYGPPPRQATAGSILSGMFDVWTKNFVNFFVVFLVVSLVQGLLGLLVFFGFFGTVGVPSGVFPTVQASDVARGVGVFVAVVIIDIIIGSIVAGGMTEYAVRRYRGEAISLQAALRRGLERFLSILGANILLALIIFGVFVLPFSVGIVLLVVSGNLAGLGFLFLGLFIGGFVALYVGLGLCLFAPAIMMENVHAIDGLRRSWGLTKGYRLSLFAAIVATLILVALISAVITVPIGSLGNPFVNLAATAVAEGIVGGLFTILLSVAYDLIVRQPKFVYGPPPYVPGPAAPPFAGGPPGGSPGAPPPPTPPTGP